MPRKKKLPYPKIPKLPRMSPRIIRDINHRLATRLVFDEIDLEANREGNITSTQLNRLHHTWRNKFFSLVVGLPLCLAFVWGCGGFAIAPQLVKDNLGQICLSVVGVYLPIYVLNEAWGIVLLALDLHQHQIRWVAGKARLGSNDLLHLGKVTLFIDDMAFSVTPQVFYWNEWYTVYYVPHSRTIISAEVSRREDFEARLEQTVITMGADGEIQVG